MIKGLVGAMGLLALLLYIGCIPPRGPVLKSEFAIGSDASQTKDNLTIAIRPLDEKAILEDAKLTRSVQLLPSSVDESALVLAMTQAQKVTIIGPPAFEVKITNRTGHIVKWEGAVFKLLDAEGNALDSLDREGLAAEFGGDLAARSRKLASVSRGEIAQALNGIKVLTPTAQVLPEGTATFLLAFAVPGAGFEIDRRREWLAKNPLMTLKLYEVPTRAGDDGRVTKRVAFEFPVSIKTFNISTTKNEDGSESVSRKEVVKQ